MFNNILFLSYFNVIQTDHFSFKISLIILIISMEKSLAEELGFYYVVMQRSLSNYYINCWIDGSETSDFYTKEELLNFVKKSPKFYELSTALQDVFNETSIFLWDVENNIIRRVSPTADSENLSKDIYKMISNRQQKLAAQKNFTGVDFRDNKITLTL